MALRIDWDIYEVALLIEACEKVIANNKAKPEIVAELSEALRKRAIKNGIVIDSKFRNKNGINLQMTKMAYLLTDGAYGLPGASKLYVDMADIKKKNPEKYQEILLTAKQQILDLEENMCNNKEKFIDWINSLPNKKFNTTIILKALEISSEFCVSRKYSKNSFWEISDPVLFSAVATKLKSMRFFRLTHRNIASALDKALELYKEFLLKESQKNEYNMSDESASIETPDNSDESVIEAQNSPSEQQSVKLPRSVQKSDELYDDESLADKLYVALKKECDINPYGATASFLSGQVGASEKTIKAVLDYVDWAVFKYGRYSIVDNNENEQLTLNLTKLASLSYTRPVSASYFDEVVSNASTWKQMYLDLLKTLQNDYPKVFDEIKGKVYPSYSSPLLGTESNLVQFRIPKEVVPGLFVETNVSARDIISNLKKFLDACNVDYENVVIIYERKDTNNQPVRKLINDNSYGVMMNSLDKTLEILRKRYSVRLIYNHFDDANSKQNDLLYKANNGIKDIIWIYFVYSRRSQYISIETEPEYLNGVNEYTKGFIKTALRTSHPCLKMFFINYNDIGNSLMTICDAIDLYFQKNGARKKEKNITKVYQKLYYLSKVYDAPNGLSLERIIQLIKLDVEESVVEDVLDGVSWATKIGKRTYCFSRKSSTASRSNDLASGHESGSSFDAAFVNWMISKGIAERTAHNYLNAVKQAERFAREHSLERQILISINHKLTIRTTKALFENLEFIELNDAQHRRFSAAIAKLFEFYGILSELPKLPSNKAEPKQTHIQPEKSPDDFSKERYISVLMTRYRGGMQFDSIDFEIFKDTYSDLYDEEIEFDDSELKRRLLFCGVYFNDRLFPAEGIIDAVTGEKLQKYIENTFESGKNVIYYKAIMTDMADDFAYCFSLTGEDMLKAYLEFASPNGKYYFYPDYMSIEKVMKVDHSDEIKEFVLSAGKPISVEEICAGLPHVSNEIIKREIQSNGCFLRNSKGCYYHIDIFEISEDELRGISRFIIGDIMEDGYAIWTHIYERIKSDMPIFLENNIYLSSLGLRKAIERSLSAEYHFEGAVISLKSTPLDMAGVYRTFAAHHRTFSLEDIARFSKEIDEPLIYFASIADVSVRVSRDLFVAKDMISFDVAAVDSAISTYLAGDYIPVKHVDSFLVFPNVGYEWNEFLLESFLNSYSEKFKLMNLSYSRKTVAGAIVKTDSSYKEFVDLVADILANSDIELKQTVALEYLADLNIIINKRYSDVGVALDKARRIRNRRE